MDIRLKIIEALLPDVHRFCEENPEPTAAGFVSFLRGDAQQPTTDATGAIAHMQQYANPGTLISFHLGRMGKYAKYYMKEVLKYSPLVSSDDFAFLATLAQVGSMNKTQLIKYNVAEMSAGMEVVRRLLKHDLITEVVSKEDRRVRTLHITEAGRATMFQILGKLGTVSKLVTGKLSAAEQQQLLALLEKLDHFHQEIYDTEDAYDLKSIEEKYL